MKGISVRQELSRAAVNRRYAEFQEWEATRQAHVDYMAGRLGAIYAMGCREADKQGITEAAEVTRVALQYLTDVLASVGLISGK